MTEIIAPKSEAILIEAREEVAVVAPQETAVVVEVRTEAAIIVPQPEAVVVEVGQQGPAGPRGADGVPGIGGELYLDDLQDVVAPAPTAGDIIRYNAATGDWESRAEPFEFRGIVLTPMALWASPAEGSVGYNAADNGIYVGVE